LSAATLPQPSQYEVVSRRILASFVCIDAITGNSVRRPMTVSANGWRIAPNHSGTYIVYDGPGLRNLTTQFVPQGAWPPASTLEVTLQDPLRNYLPRKVKINAPQSVPVIPAAPVGSTSNPAALAALSDPTTIFCAQSVNMFPAPSAPVATTWAVLRVSVQRAAAPFAGVPWTVVRVVRTSDSAVLAVGQTDSNGEALLAVIGPTTQTNTSGTGPITLPTTAISITAYADPSTITQPTGWISNPGDLLSNLANPALVSSSLAAQLAAGKELRVNFALTI
jgi:hypothetical protein